MQINPNATLEQELYMLNIYQQKRLSFWNPLWVLNYFRKMDVESLFLYIEKNQYTPKKLITIHAFTEEARFPYKCTRLKPDFDNKKYTIDIKDKKHLKHLLKVQSRTISKRYCVLVLEKENKQPFYLFLNINPTNICKYGFNLYHHPDFEKANLSD